MHDTFAAFLPGGIFSVAGAAGGPLAGLTFAAKDVFDVAGHRTGNGQPVWCETHPPAAAHAPAVAKLLDAGATLAGKTVCDEMCYSLAGDNAHYGAPVNPAAPDRAVGGSSSGSAAAVAGGLVDFALGTDCGGSVRCPASFTGIHGLRPTHGRVDARGVPPLAASFDVVGWFARDAGLMRRIGGVLLEGAAVGRAPARLVVATDGFSRLDADERDAAAAAADTILDRLGLPATEAAVAPDGLDHWFAAFRHLQALEIWAQHGEWIAANAPAFGPGVKERFAYAATLGPDDRARWQPVRDAAAARLDDLLGDEALLVLPTAPVSPRRDATAAEIEAFRASAMGLTCLAGLSGRPQVTLPLATARGAPLGLSLLGPRGGDETLLDLAATIARA